MERENSKSSCPLLEHVVASAIRKCPFLSQLAADHGQAHATAVATIPRQPAKSPVFPESLADFKASFRLFHGANGVVPLVRSESRAVLGEVQQCPFHTLHSLPVSTPPGLQKGKKGADGLTDRPSSGGQLNPLAGAPFASASSSLFRFLPGPGDFLSRRRKKRQERRDRRAESKRNESMTRRPAASRAQNFRLEKWRAHPLVGGLIPLNAAGRYMCPPLVVAGRQAVARLKSVQLLRLQALPVKLLGVSTHCLLANIPCGAIREHTDKFSAAWFVAVHATVPFFAFMRKGVGMPKWAIALTLGSAVMGQAIGARLERRRLELAVGAREVHQGSLPPSASQDSGQAVPVVRKSCEQASQFPAPAAVGPPFWQCQPGRMTVVA